MSKLTQSMRPVASFRIANSGNTSKKVCLFPGHYETGKVYVDTTTGEGAVVNNDPTAINNAGYACDIMLADVNATSKVNKDVVATPNSARCRYADFLNYIKLSGARVSKIKISNLGGSSHRNIFDQELEVSASAIGQKVGSQFVQLSSYKNAQNYDLDVIEIDLAANNLELDETTLAFLTVPSGADFNMEFTLAE